MNCIHLVPGSFRDPSGRVYRVADRIFRTVTEFSAADFEFVNSTGLIEKLARDGLILPLARVNSDILGPIGYGAKYVLEVPILPFVSFPYEWPFPALKAAALLHLEIHLAALEQGVTLSDGSAYNVQFQGTRPVFIDHLSFRRYRNGEIWAGHRQFCEQFLNPLLLRAFFGVSHNAWYRGAQEGITVGDLRRFLTWRHLLNWNVFTHVMMQSFFQRAAQDNHVELEKGLSSPSALPLVSLRRMLQRLHKWISRLEPADRDKTVWRDYAKRHSYSSQETELKKNFVLDFVGQTQPKMLWDLGCNTGQYSKAALEGGAKYVVGFDFDQGALDVAFQKAREENLPFQPLFMDVANPTPNQGWNEQERPGLLGRASADALLALAFVHHLAIARNIPFDQLLDWLVNLAPNGVIEFVPKEDPMVQHLLRFREDIFPNYTKEFFFARIAERTRVVKTQTVSPSDRVLLWYVRH